jgi:hypothetical protein
MLASERSLAEGNSQTPASIDATLAEASSGSNGEASWSAHKAPGRKLLGCTSPVPKKEVVHPRFYLMDDSGGRAVHTAGMRLCFMGAVCRTAIHDIKAGHFKVTHRKGVYLTFPPNRPIGHQSQGAKVFLLSMFSAKASVQARESDQMTLFDNFCIWS